MKTATKTAMQYARECIENGRINAKSKRERAEQIEVEVEFAARMDGRKDAVQLATEAKRWYLR